MLVTENSLSNTIQPLLLDVSEQYVRRGLAGSDWLEPVAEWYPTALQQNQACFVALFSKGRLLGSIGTSESVKPLIVNVARNAFDVGTSLMQPVSLDVADLRDLSLELTVLSPLRPILASTFDSVVEQLRPGCDGVFMRYLDDNNRSATFLPRMWEQYADPKEFVRQLSTRAGIDVLHWSSSIRIATFSTETFTRSIMATAAV